MHFLPPRIPLLPSEGRVWPQRMLNVVAALNRDRYSLSDNDWHYFKKNLPTIDPQAWGQWKADGDKRRAITHAINFLTVEELQKVLDYKRNKEGS